MTKAEQALFDKEVLGSKILNCDAAIRGLRFDLEAAEIAGDEGIKKRAVDLVAKQLKLKDAYQQILDKLKEGEKDESVS